MKFLSMTCLCFFLAFNVNAIEYIQKFYKYKYKNDSELINELKNRKCTKIPLQLELIKKRYPHLKANKYIKLQTCHQDLSFSDEDLGIISWYEHSPKHNFILSNYLFDEKCKNIYTKQIPQFNKKNKIIYDPSIILKKQKILLQKCKNYDVLNNNTVIDSIENSEDFYFKKNENLKSTFFDKELEANIQQYKNITLYGMRYTNDFFLSELIISHSHSSLKIDKFIGKNTFKPLIFIGYTNMNKINEPIIYGVGFNYKYKTINLKSELQIKKTYPYTLEISKEIGTNFKSSIYRNVNGIGIGLSIFFN